ncbi:MAG: hypothetical protein RR415_06090 [Ruthenibacterium sp.]
MEHIILLPIIAGIVLLASLAGACLVYQRYKRSRNRQLRLVYKFVEAVILTLALTALTVLIPAVVSIFYF